MVNSNLAGCARGAEAQAHSDIPMVEGAKTAALHKPSHETKTFYNMGPAKVDYS